MHVGPHWWVLGLLKGPLGQRHLAGRLLAHFRRLRQPLGLTLCVEKAVTFSSLLKATTRHTIQCLLAPRLTAPCCTREPTAASVNREAKSLQTRGKRDVPSRGQPVRTFLTA